MSKPDIPFRPARLSHEESQTRAQNAFRRMDARRTVRHFSSDPVPREIIETCVRAGSTAPSGAHRQPWFFVAIQDPELKASIRRAAEDEERRNYGGRMPEEWLQALEPFGTDADKPYLTTCPWLIVVFAQDRGPEGKNYYVSESVGLAAGMLISALHEAGLAVLTHTPSPMKFLKDILGRPKGERAVLLLGVGYPSADCEVPDIQRKALSQVLELR